MKTTLRGWWGRATKSPVLLVAYGFVAVTIGAGAMYLVESRLLQPSPERPGAEHAEARETHDHEHGDHGESGHARGHVVLPKAKWASAGLKIEPARRGSFRRTEWVTGKLTVNDDRTAHIYPLVEGRIHQVHVRFGQDVTRGEVLAVVDSREVGDAKLTLYQNRLETRIAEANADWADSINENTQALIQALEQGTPLEKLDSMFRGKAMGENRQTLLAAYADLHKARIDYERLKPLAEKGITSGKQLLAAKAAYESAQAKFRAWLEQLKFTAWMDAFHSQQKLDRARSQEEITQAKLFILGYAPERLQDIDPRAEGEAISHYEVRAPFDGTIISKDAALQERVGPETQLFELTDLSSLWVQADVYQKHLPHLQNLSEDTLRFRTSRYGHEHQAEIFYQGDVLDPETRTARLMAVVENTDGHLKPGMFVEVELPGEIVQDALQIPAAAVVEDRGSTYVFVQQNDEHFRRKDVKVGRSSTGMVEIVDGLQPGDRVAVAGLFALKTAAQGDVASTHSH